MHKLMSVQYVGLAAAVIGCSALAAPAAVVLDQNFNNTSTFVPNTAITMTGVGDSSTSAGHWAAGQAATPQPTPKQAPEKTAGDQAIQLTRTGGGATSLIGSRDAADGITDGIFSYQISVYMDSSDSSAIINPNEVANGGSKFPIGIFLAAQKDHNLYVRNSADSAWSITGKTVPTGTWTTFRALVDIDQGTWSLFATIGTDSEINIINSQAFETNNLGTVDSVTVLPQPPNTQPTFWVDDIKIESVPEPASLGLLAGGMVMIALKRRRPGRDRGD